MHMAEYTLASIVLHATEYRDAEVDWRMHLLPGPIGRYCYRPETLG